MHCILKTPTGQYLSPYYPLLDLLDVTLLEQTRIGGADEKLPFWGIQLFIHSPDLKLQY